MTETSLTHEQEHHEESHARMYFKVAGALLVLTLVEYSYASWMPVSFLVLVLGLMAMASVKAGLVAWYFMHLKFEGNWVYMWLIPAGFLMMVFILTLYPDIGTQRTFWPSYSDEDQGATAPLEPAAQRSLRA